MVPRSLPAIVCPHTHFCQVSTHCAFMGRRAFFTYDHLVLPQYLALSHLHSRPTLGLSLGTKGDGDHPGNSKASLRSGLARVLLGITCTPMAGGLGNLTVYHPVVEGGWGARKEEEAAFVKRYCSARGKVPLKAACPVSWGSRTQSPGDGTAPVFAQVARTKPRCEASGTVLC